MLFCRLSDLYLKEVFVIDLAKMWGQSSHVGPDHLSQELLSGYKPLLLLLSSKHPYPVA